MKLGLCYICKRLVDINILNWDGEGLYCEECK